MKAEGKAAREARSPTNGKAAGEDVKPHTNGKSPSNGRATTVEAKLSTHGRAAADGKPLDADDAPAATNGHGADRPPPSPWRASRERQHDREVKREAVIRAAAHAFNLKG